MAVGSWFTTDFDVPHPVGDLPAVVDGGHQPTVCVVDQMVRGHQIIGRAVGDPATVGIKVRPAWQPIRVAVTLQLDDAGTRWWASRVKPDPAQAERPRLVVLSSQGRIRGAAVLARRQGWLRAGGSKETISFELAADELGDDDLLLVEMSDPRIDLPGWADGRFSTSSAIGLRIDRIHLDPLPTTEPPPPSAATSGCPFLVVPATSPETVRVRVGTVPPAPPVPRNPTRSYAKRKPARAVLKVLRTARRAAGRASAEAGGDRVRPDDLTVDAVDLTTGAAVPVRIVDRGAHTLDLRLPTDREGPVLLGVTEPGGHRRERTARQLDCRFDGGTP
ncbi:hypothetical protein [Micromonospora sp. SH-82]|uniref:hypothetical protein n=1 Tax=Micromonospora sp. SH-82 TaxID=3132938 RepID=UPI003EBCD64B